jgi:hypothetical protein
MNDCFYAFALLLKSIQKTTTTKDIQRCENILMGNWKKERKALGSHKKLLTYLFSEGSEYELILV